MQDWKTFSKNLQPTLIEAAARLHIKSDQLFGYIREYKIVPVNKEEKQRLKKIDFVWLIRHFDDRTYQYFHYYFEDMEISEKKRLHKEFLQTELRRKSPVTKKKRLKEPKSPPPFRLPYVPPAPLEQRLLVPWEEIIFNDYNIIVKLGKSFSRPWPAPDSRKSFK